MMLPWQRQLHTLAAAKEAFLDECLQWATLKESQTSLRYYQRGKQISKPHTTLTVNAQASERWVLGNCTAPSP